MAAGSGLVAASDTNLTKVVIGATVASGPYSTAPANNWVACYNTQFTSATKAGATEWVTSSDGAYARQAMGAAGAGWTINAYVNGTGVLFTNINAVVQPAVTLNAQTLFSIGYCDSVGPTGGNVLFFCDLASSVAVGIGNTVTIAAYTGAGTGMAFTTY